MTEKRGLLTPDYSDIKVVPDASRSVWFRKARPDYFCIRCGRRHRTWSAIGEAHDLWKRRDR